MTTGHRQCGPQPVTASRTPGCTRFRWQPGSVAFWDNRQVRHLAVNDYQGRRRVINRILLTGTRLLPAEAR